MGRLSGKYKKQSSLTARLTAYSATAGAALAASSGAHAAITNIDDTNFTYMGTEVGPGNLPTTVFGTRQAFTVEAFKFGADPYVNTFDGFNKPGQVASAISGWLSPTVPLAPGRINLLREKVSPPRRE